MVANLQDHKVDAWVRFAADDKVIIRDPNKDREFYLLDTKGDGACWICMAWHVATLMNSPGQGLSKNY